MFCEIVDNFAYDVHGRRNQRYDSDYAGTPGMY